jgi:peptide/nickel transport system substrate-binding protein
MQSSKHRGVQGGRRATVAGALATALVALVGCSSAVNDQEPTSADGDDTSDAVEQEAPAEAGGTLNIVAAADAQPQFAMANRAGNWSWRRLVFESLVELDENAQPQPLLAENWTYSDDRTELAVVLRDDVAFHSGREMTAEDVVYTLEQVKDPANASQLAGIAANIESVEATGDYEVSITLSEASDSLFDLLDLTPVVDQETWPSIADGTEVVGTGPFVWNEWNPGASISLSKNEAYRDPERPMLDGVEVSILSDSTALQSALKSGSADFAIGMAQSDVSILKDDNAYALAQAGGVFYPFGVDVSLEPFDQPEVRHALGFAVDRERIRDQVFGGDAVITDLWWTPDSPGYPDDLAGHYSYDPAKAKQLLDQAGATGAEINIAFANLPVMNNMFEIVQNNLTEVGFEVTGEALDLTEYDKRQVEGTLGQSFLLLHGMAGFSAATIVDAMPSIRPGNPSNFDTEEYEQLKAAVKSATEDTRDQALADLSQYMLDESFSHIVVVAPQYHVHSADLKDVKVVSLGSLVATDAYVAE